MNNPDEEVPAEINNTSSQPAWAESSSSSLIVALRMMSLDHILWSDEHTDWCCVGLTRCSCFTVSLSLQNVICRAAGALYLPTDYNQYGLIPMLNSPR